jgi:hypothetical protein
MPGLTIAEIRIKKPKERKNAEEKEKYGERNRGRETGGETRSRSIGEE